MVAELKDGTGLGADGVFMSLMALLDDGSIAARDEDSGSIIKSRLRNVARCGVGSNCKWRKWWCDGCWYR